MIRGHKKAPIGAEAHWGDNASDELVPEALDNFPARTGDAEDPAIATREALAGPKDESDVFFVESFERVLRDFYSKPGPHPEIYLKAAPPQYGRREPFLIAVRDPRSMRRVTLTIIGAAALTRLTVDAAVKAAILFGYAGVGMAPPPAAHTI